MTASIQCQNCNEIFLAKTKGRKYCDSCRLNENEARRKMYQHNYRQTHKESINARSRAKTKANYPIIKYCINCGIAFFIVEPKKSNTKHCERCFNISNRALPKIVKLVCRMCGGNFLPQSDSNGRYLKGQMARGTCYDCLPINSNSYKYPNPRALIKAKQCKMCRKIFCTRRGNKKYCSEKCKKDGLKILQKLSQIKKKQRDDMIACPQECVDLWDKSQNHRLHFAILQQQEAERIEEEKKITERANENFDFSNFITENHVPNILKPTRAQKKKWYKEKDRLGIVKWSDFMAYKLNKEVR